MRAVLITADGCTKEITVDGQPPKVFYSPCLRPMRLSMYAEAAQFPVSSTYTTRAYRLDRVERCGEYPTFNYAVYREEL